MRSEEFLSRLGAGLLLTALFIFAPGTAQWAGSGGAFAGELNLTLGGTFRVPVVSIREARFQTVVRQQYDYSCGSAALATLLTYHYDRPTAEDVVFVSMFNVGDQQKIQREGFSLLDMKNFLARQGLTADGFQVSLDKVAEIGVPVITLINTNGYRHFVVLKGIADGEVVIGDPAFGVNIMPIDRFQMIWSGIVFLIRNEPSKARDYFNHHRDWRVRQKAPFGTALTRDALANFTLLSTFMQNEF